MLSISTKSTICHLTSFFSSSICFFEQYTGSFKPAKQEQAMSQVETRKPFHKIRRIEENITITDTHPRFGPVYRKDPDPFKDNKDEAWGHISDKDKELSEALGWYLTRAKEIVLRHSYDPPIGENNMTTTDFLRMMKIDGCFFLQLALHILGGTDLLGYPENHPYFGLNIDDQEINKRISAMFFVGNQVPWVVIRVLMKQSFFQAVIQKGIAKGTWQLPSSWPKMALYLLLVFPKLERSPRHWISELLVGQKRIPHVPSETPKNVLHFLYCLVLGTGDASEAEYIAFDEVVDTEDPESNNRFPSATELVQKGVSLKNSKKGLRDIRFEKKFFYFGSLYVPPLIFHDDHDAMFQYLISYEITQEMKKQEVAVYFRFLKDFIRSKDDVKLLESKGIIEVQTKGLKNRLASMITKNGSYEQVPFTENYRLARLHAANYSSSPWAIRFFIFILFTMVPAVFSVLSYVFPRK